jgi:uncharacterized protein YegP (UPF0339 family)
MATRPGYVEIYKTPSGFRWRIVAANGNKLANSGQAYSRRLDCVRALDVVVGDAKGWTRSGA